MSTDYLVKALAFDGVIRAYAVRSTDTVGEVQRRHQMWPTATAALGRTISAAVMMGAMLKGDNKLTVKIQGDGPLGPIVVDANAKGEVRGYATHSRAVERKRKIGCARRCWNGRNAICCQRSWDERLFHRSSTDYFRGNSRRLHAVFGCF